jgi:5-methylcytosine-specific restriction enzyme A
MTKTPKISKAQGRSVKEWVGATPDAKVPPAVRLRILRRHEAKCYLTKIIIADGQAFDLEHMQPLEEGGEHRESNLAPVLRLPHEVKTAAERKRQAKADRVAKKAHGIVAPKAKIQSRGFDTSAKAPRIQKQPLPPRQLYEDIT